MEERIDHIVSLFEEAVRTQSADEATLTAALGELQSLDPITEVDRVHKLGGLLRVFNIVIENLPPETTQGVRDQRAVIVSAFQRQVGSSDTPYIRSRTIVEEVAAQLAAGEDSDTVASGAIEELQALPFDDVDEGERGIAILAVGSLRVAYDWRRVYDVLKFQLDPIDPRHTALFLNAACFDVAGFDKDLAVKSAKALRDDRFSLDGTPQGHATALMVIVGSALRLNPTALPGLAAPIEWLAEAVNEAHMRAPVAAVSGLAAEIDALIASFERELESAGFSEQVWNEHVATLREMTPETDADRRTISQTLLRLIDTAVPRAPRDWAETLQVLRRSIEKQSEEPGSPIDVATFEAAARALVQRLRDELAAGRVPAAAFTQAMQDLQALGSRVEGTDEEAGRVFMQVMPEVMSAMVPYAEEGKATLAADVEGMFRRMMQEAEGALAADPAAAEIGARAAMREFQPLLNQVRTNAANCRCTAVAFACSNGSMVGPVVPARSREGPRAHLHDQRGRASRAHDARPSLSGHRLTKTAGPACTWPMRRCGASHWLN